jgi:hypothetical protein
MSADAPTADNPDHRNITNAVENGERTELETPIKVTWDGTARAKIKGHCLDADNPRADLFVETTDRLKTRLVCRTAEEAAAVLSQLSRYGPGRTWLNPNQSRTLRRVENEIVGALEERRYTVVQDDRLFTVFEQPLVADGGQKTCRRCGQPITHTVCSGPGAATNSCGCSVDPELATDGGVPESFEDLAGTCESCGEDVDPDWLIEGTCPGCEYRPDAMADGGEE